MSRFSSWRLALRIARRDARRAKGRSALVVAMIALPILGVTAADLAVRSGDLSGAEQLTRDIGQADARFSVETPGGPLFQSPDGMDMQFLTDDDWATTAERPMDEVEDTLAGLLPDGTELLTDFTVEGVVDTGSGLLNTEIRELDAAHPVTEGMMTLLRGGFPEGAGQVAVTEGFLADSGLDIGSELRFTGREGAFRITGVYELPDDLDGSQLVAPPASVLPLSDQTAVWDPLPTVLAVVPGGGVPWPTVVAANEHGLSAVSRDVLADPPADADVPLWADGGSPDWYRPGVDTTFVAATVTAVSLVVLEICLLAGPAFAVGARRSRRQLGLVGANGGDRRHLRAIMLSGGVVLGAVAAVIGVLGGIALTLAAHPLIEERTGKRFGAWDFRPAELAGIAVLAVVVGLLAAAIPAYNAARGSVLESLGGRRGVRRGSRALPVIGSIMLVAGAGVALFGGLVSDRTDLVALGAVTAELGLVALTPALVGACGRLGRRLPLAGRLALRDAARNRGRTAPAVAAVLAAVAGTVAVSTILVSDDAQNRAEYTAILPEGTVRLIAYSVEERESLDGAREVAERELPVAERADYGEVRSVDAVCDADDVLAGADCGTVSLAVAPGQLCPLSETGAENLPVEERRALDQDPRCADEESLGIGSTTLYVGGPELLSVLGVADGEVRRAAEALDRGEAVVFGDRYVSPSGEVTLEVWRHDAPDGNEASAPDITAAFTAHRVDGESYGVPGLITPETAEAAGLTVTETGTLYSTTEVPSRGEKSAFEGSLTALGVAPWSYIEDGYDGGSDTTLLILTLAALVITLGAAGIATGLAQADSEADLATLASVGASPRVRRTLSGLQCGLIAAMGVLLGAVSGLIPAIGLRLAQHRFEVDQWERGWAGGWMTGAKPELFIELPWATFAQLIVVVPLLACGLAALLTRSRVHLARRAG
ncbi:ABC transporter permease [Streptomyces specialis]|uniref:ABC transporter permease n=1 Tax=Streptomyces specialis TaxID=498367 RepID=UPI00073E3286|nr:ABC transporter permease [Streptomyces specialis]